MLRKALVTLPMTLDDTYVRILCSIKDEYQSYAFKILQWLAFSVRPLLIEEAVDIIAVDEEPNGKFDPDNRLPDPRDILTICSSLVIITARERADLTVTEELSLAYYSVKEYLISERISNGPAWRFEIAVEPDVCIAYTCLLYLSYFQELDYPASGVPENFLTKFPLLNYVVHEWHHHARKVENYSEEISHLSTEFLQSSNQVFAKWALTTGRAYEDCEPAGAPLYLASWRGLSRSVKALIDRGSDVNAVGGRYDTALRAAVEMGYYKIVQLLLDAGADINAVAGRYGTALRAAVEVRHYKIVRLLLDAGADINAMPYPRDGSARSTALYAAIRSHDLEIVRLLVDAGADVNLVGESGITALQEAIPGQTYGIFRLLLDAGPNVNAAGPCGTALQIAAERDDPKRVQMLLDAGANVNLVSEALLSDRIRGTAIHAAVYYEYCEVLQLLMFADADVNIVAEITSPVGRITEYHTPLTLALSSRHDNNVKYAEWLLSTAAIHTVNTDTTPPSVKKSALKAATRKEKAPIVARLLEAGAEVNWHTEAYCQKDDYQDYIEMLLKAGAEGSVFTESSSDAVYSDVLHIATCRGEKDVILLLLKAGAKVDKRAWHDDPRFSDIPARTPEEVIQRLVELGMHNINEFDDAGRDDLEGENGEESESEESESEESEDIDN